VAATVPVVAGEIGENDCNGSFVDRFMAWADTAQISYLGWTWNTWDCGSGPALISSYEGVPTGFGAVYRDHLSVLARQSREVGTVIVTWALVPHRR
jgi:endoglucanase